MLCLDPEQRAIRPVCCCSQFAGAMQFLSGKVAIFASRRGIFTPHLLVSCLLLQVTLGHKIRCCLFLQCFRFGLVGNVSVSKYEQA